MVICYSNCILLSIINYLLNRYFEPYVSREVNLQVVDYSFDTFDV